MNKRTWIALGVFAVLLVAYQVWIYFSGRSKGQAPMTADTTQVQPSVSQAPADTGAKPPPETTKPEPAPSFADEGLIKVETPRFNVELTRRGGRIYSLTLKGFKGPDRKENQVNIIRPGSEFLATWFDHGLYCASPDSVLSVEEGKDITLTFEGPEGKKFYTFSGGYTFSVWIEGPDTSRLYLKPALSVTEADRTKDIAEHHFVYQRNGKVASESIKKVLGPGKGTPGDNLGWFGTRSKYFLFACVLEEGALKSLAATAESDTVMKIEATLAKTPVSLLVYVGPFDYDVLRRVGYGLEESYSFGFWLIAPFARLIFILFRWLHWLIPNYGWVILVFSLAMKLAFSPLSYKTYKSMKKMQDLKPKMEALQAKFKDKPDELNKAVMELYKGEKVNPLSGCIPVLLQLPIFWALYQVLNMTIDLRAAPWIFWIQDLSAKDPFYVLPIVMGAISLLNGFLQPSADRQAKLTSALMAGVFTFIFLNFPAGIVLYWLSYNLYSIAEQAIFRRMLKKKPEA
ncbi:MAG: membrane protein insertase YidC [candidate division WOR-3 bacterium]